MKFTAKRITTMYRTETIEVELTVDDLLNESLEGAVDLAVFRGAFTVLDEDVHPDENGVGIEDIEAGA